MKVKFWGVRGSVPVPGPETAFFGGNTSCAEVRAGETVIIVDAGTGIRGLGSALMAAGKPLEAHILVTHTHWDHLCGFPFFAPIYEEGTKLWVYGKGHFGSTLEDIVENQMKYSYFPVRAALLPAAIKYEELERTSFKIDSVEVEVMNMNHPVLSLGYRLTFQGKAAVFTGDHEPYYDFIAQKRDETQVVSAEDVRAMIEEQNQRVVEFASGADLLVADGQYTPEEYKSKRGWGHMSYEHAVRLAVDAGVRQAALTHHDPERTDAQVSEIEERARELAGRISERAPRIFAAREKMEVAL